MLLRIHSPSHHIKSPSSSQKGVLSVNWLGGVWEQYNDRQRMPYISISSKTGDGVLLAFHLMTSMLTAMTAAIAMEQPILSQEASSQEASSSRCIIQ
jgi:hypothetical protein